MTVSINKKYTTRSGLPVRILATDLQNPHVQVVATIMRDGIECVNSFTKEGKYYSCGTESHADLIEVKPRITCDLWVNVYADYAHSFPNREEANNYSRNDRLACVKVTIDVEEGEGI